ncbi:threonine/serine exporter family protein, partial [Streptomyces cyaneofuscatus]
MRVGVGAAEVGSVRGRGSAGTSVRPSRSSSVASGLGYSPVTPSTITNRYAPDSPTQSPSSRPPPLALSCSAFTPPSSYNAQQAPPAFTPATGIPMVRLTK